MEDENAIKTLTELLNKKSLNKKEKEAILHAIGTLSWTKFAEKGIKSSGEKRRRKIQE